MNRDWLRKLLGDGATDEVVNSLMEANGKDVNAAKASSALLESRLEEANGRIKQLEDDADAKLTDGELLQKRLEEANAKADKAMRDLNEASAAAVLAGAGIAEEDYAPFLGSIAGGSREEAVSNAKAIASVVAAKVASAEETAKKAALGAMPKPKGGDEPGAVTTKKKFFAMSDSEQVKWKSEHPDAWKRLS